MPFPWVAAIGGASNLGSGLFGYFGQKKANETNLKIAREANAANLDLWNKTNEYNSPAMQMARYKEAGLNPALIYGNGSSSAGNAPQPQRWETAQVVNEMDSISKMDALPALSLYQDIKVKKAQEDQIRANTELIKRKEVNENLRQRLIGAQSAFQEFNLAKNAKLLPYQTSTAEQNIERLRRSNANALLYGQSLKAGTIAKQIEAAKSQIDLDFKRQFQRVGTQVTDPFLWRLLSKWLLSVPVEEVPEPNDWMN